MSLFSYPNPFERARESHRINLVYDLNRILNRIIYELELLDRIKDLGRKQEESHRRKQEESHRRLHHRRLHHRRLHHDMKCGMNHIIQLKQPDKCRR